MTKNKNLKYYNKFLVEFPYDKAEVLKNFRKEKENEKEIIKVKRSECCRVNGNSRVMNLKYFNKNLQKTIRYYLDKSGYNGDDIKTLLGLSYSTLSYLYENKYDKELDFKLIYDLCIALNVQMSEFVEKLEGEF